MAEIDNLRKDAKTAYRARDFGRAAELYRRILLIGATDPAGESSDRLGYASTLAAMSRLDDAAVQLERVVGLAPGDARNRHRLADMQSRLGRHADAIDQLREAERLEPDAATHPLRLAMEYRSLGREAEAQAALDRCLALDPDNTEAQVFKLEQIILQPPERDGQDEPEVVSSEAGAGAPQPGYGRAPPPVSRSRALRQTPIVVAIEAIAITALALWLRSLMP